MVRITINKSLVVKYLNKICHFKNNYNRYVLEFNTKNIILHFNLVEQVLKYSHTFAISPKTVQVCDIVARQLCKNEIEITSVGDLTKFVRLFIKDFKEVDDNLIYRRNGFIGFKKNYNGLYKDSMGWYIGLMPKRRNNLNGTRLRKDA